MSRAIGGYIGHNQGGLIGVTSASGGADTALRAFFVPPAPAAPTAAAGNTQVSLTWSAPTVLAQTPITDYVIQYSSDSGSTWTTFSDGTSTATSATVTGLTNGTAYTFRVAAVNGVGQGAYSSAGNSVTPFVATDANFSSVSLLLHMDGIAGSTMFVDSSGSPKTVTANNGVAISTDGRFSSGGLFDGSDDYLSVPNSGEFDFGTDDFTIECWLKRTNGRSICAGSGGGDFMFATDTQGEDLGFGRNLIAWDLRANGVTYGTGWNHVAACRASGTLRLFLNGNVVATGSAGFSYSAGSTLLVGVRAGSGATRADYFSGGLDELRITKGVARYTANFTPAADPFPNG